MDRAILLLLLVAGSAAGHPGHGAPQMHFHGIGWDHILLAIAGLGIAALAAWRMK
ncbi:MAG TPA: hypothetical protein VHG88_10445 [Burkholderiales bacterium]|nr:hypothetical protein [Burkholderiales bacterium]